MGSSSKQKHRDRDGNGNDQSNSSNSRKRKHHCSSATSEDRHDRSGATGDGSGTREKRHKHKRHHRDKKREKQEEKQEYASSDSDVVEVLPQEYIAPEAAGDGQSHSSLSVDETNRMRAKLGLKPLQVGPLKTSKASSSQPTTQPSQSSHDRLSVAASDQIRAKLGLKPLQVGTSEAHSTRDIDGNDDEESDDGKLQDDLGEFYHRPAGNITAEKKAEKIKQRLDDRKARRAIESKLAKIKSLGTDANDDLDDPLAWVNRSRQTQSAKVAAAHRAAYLDALDEQFGVAEVIQRGEKQKRAKAYGEKQLKGLRVEHDMGRFMDDGHGGLTLEGKGVVLTLKDQGVLDDGGDVLVNVNMVDDERYEKSNLNKKRKLPHDFYFDEQLDEFGNPLPQSILGKYDEDLDGNKATSDHFIIGHSTSTPMQLNKATTLNNRTSASNSGSSIKEKLAESLLSNMTIASEYYNEDELAAFKKPKKVRKKMRKKAGGTEGGVAAFSGGNRDQVKSGSEAEKWIEGVGTRRPGRMESSGGRNHGAGNDLAYDDIPAAEDFTGLKVEDENEDYLERVLNKARKLKLQERNQAMPNVTDILSQIKPEIDEEGESPNYGKDSATLQQPSSSIILNSTAEFCRTLGDIPTYGRSGNRDDMTGNSTQEDMETIDSYIKPNRRNSHGKHRMITMEIDSDDEQGNGQQAPYDDDDDLQIMETDGRGQSRWSNVDGSGGSGAGASGSGGGGGIGDKPILDEEPDVGAGVGAALKLAMSKGYLDKDETNRPSNTRLAHLQAKHYSIEDKAHGEGGEGERPGRRGGSAADRYSGPVQDFKEKETFRPNVKLEYIDDDGHVLNAKEAFRYLSHKFHGKGPGKNKVEKRIKKSQQEGLMKKMSSTDTPLGTLNMLQNKQKEMQSAFIVLSGGKHTHSTTTAISKSRR